MLLPARNRCDFDEIPEPVRKRLEFVWLDRAEQVIKVALTETPIPIAVRHEDQPKAA